MTVIERARPLAQYPFRWTDAAGCRTWRTAPVSRGNLEPEWPGRSDLASDVRRRRIARSRVAGARGPKRGAPRGGIRPRRISRQRRVGFPVALVLRRTKRAGNLRSGPDGDRRGGVAADAGRTAPGRHP